MITLHAGESNGALVLWGEASGDDGVHSTSRRRGTKAPYASLHPFAASTGELTEALRKMSLGLKPAASPACHVTASAVAEHQVRGGVPEGLPAWD
jgi:hypothetical protein